MTGNKTNTVVFDIGDRVVSTVMGYYSGLPGKVIKKITADRLTDNKYLVELDCGIKIALKQFQIAYYIND
ncbi:hypothetical protein HZY88_02685 [Aerococcaceae bacterium DSM 111176]|nr:hypothetical protein [Aerococcaceae bacterium DSM 111176]